MNVHAAPRYIPYIQDIRVIEGGIEMNPIKFVVSLNLSEKDVKRIMDNTAGSIVEEEIYNRVRNAICRQMVTESLRRCAGDCKSDCDEHCCNRKVGM